MAIQHAAPAVRVAPSYTVRERDVLQYPTEWLAMLRAPGKAINVGTFTHLDKTRSNYEADTSHVGIHYKKTSETAKQVNVSVQDVPRPGGGSWNPYEFMPSFAFDRHEDAFPTSPTFNTTKWQDWNDNTIARYQDGVIGGKQPLRAGFAVAKKGDYYVLTYSFYYATNKATGDAHASDYSTAEVYLKATKDGLKPAYLYTSWHHGGELTPYSKLAKDADGRPVVRIMRGTHATQPVPAGAELPAEGVALRGKNGQASLNGKALKGETMGFDAFQGNVKHATKLDAHALSSIPRLEAMRWGAAGLDPLSVHAFDHPHPWRELAGTVERKAKSAFHSLLNKL